MKENEKSLARSEQAVEHEEKSNDRRKLALPLAENAYHILRNRIIQGLVTEGEALLEESLSDNLGMSRTPVRTALTRLKAEGLIVEGSDRTLRVPKLDAKSIEDTFRARITIESAVVELAAEKATDEQIQRLEHLLWDEEVAHNSFNELLTSMVDGMFHAYLAEIAGNAYFIEFSSRTNARSSLMLAQSGTLREAIIPALVEHRKILGAIRQHDPAAAKEAMEEHLVNVQARIRLYIEAESETHQ